MYVIKRHHGYRYSFLSHIEKGLECWTFDPKKAKQFTLGKAICAQKIIRDKTEITEIRKENRK